MAKKKKAPVCRGPLPLVGVVENATAFQYDSHPGTERMAEACVRLDLVEIGDWVTYWPILADDPDTFFADSAEVVGLEDDGVVVMPHKNFNTDGWPLKPTKIPVDGIGGVGEGEGFPRMEDRVPKVRGYPTGRRAVQRASVVLGRLYNEEAHACRERHGLGREKRLKRKLMR